ncbi:MAG: IS110 family transposase [Acidobacteria bacterium]|nr:IS110 family transposase [Acidobacteriota bacterium]
MEQINQSESPEVVRRLKRDLVKAASTLSIDEARYLVDAYYAMQEYRKSAANQVRALAESKEPHEVLRWLFEQNDTVEKQIRRALDSWTDALPAARWAKSICGIGPVISAGLAAHIDITRCATVGRIWRFAGLDPTVEWKKGEKRPWNAGLKCLCWKIGESFVKVSGRDDDFYGKLYLQRKAIEQERNEAGKFADQAARKLERFKIGKSTDAYKAYTAGKLPPAHIHARAKRWAVKLFLAHYHHVAYTLATGTAPPKPYVISILGHADMILPPNFPMREVA